jgi:hypothetical protein
MPASESWSASQAAQVYEATSSFSVLQAPNITVHCLYTQGVPTPNQLVYKSADFRDSPAINYADGDGTVPLSSMEVCKEWAEQQSLPVHVRVFPGVGHTDILASKEGFLAVLQAVVGSSTCGATAEGPRDQVPAKENIAEV